MSTAKWQNIAGSKKFFTYVGDIRGYHGFHRIFRYHLIEVSVWLGLILEQESNQKGFEHNSELNFRLQDYWKDKRRKRFQWQSTSYPLLLKEGFELKTYTRFLNLYICRFGPQIREQMSGPKISQYEKSILGCGPLVWAGLWNKRVWADYEQLLRLVFFTFLRSKNKF